MYDRTDANRDARDSLPSGPVGRDERFNALFTAFNRGRSEYGRRARGVE